MLFLLLNYLNHNERIAMVGRKWYGVPFTQGYLVLAKGYRYFTSPRNGGRK